MADPAPSAARLACANHAQFDEAMLPEPPAEVSRPALAHFLWSRKIEYREAAGLIGKSHETVRLYCLPFGDPKRIEPDAVTARRIEQWTRGRVRPSSFKPPCAEAAA